MRPSLSEWGLTSPPAPHVTAHASECNPQRAGRANVSALCPEPPPLESLSRRRSAAPPPASSALLQEARDPLLRPAYQMDESPPPQGANPPAMTRPRPATSIPDGWPR